MNATDRQSPLTWREMALAADGSCAALLGNGILVIRELGSESDRKLVGNLVDHEYSLRLSHDGRRVSLQNHFGQFRIWNTSTGELVTSLKTSGKYSDVQMMPDGGSVIRLSDSTGHIERVDAVTGEVKTVLKAPWLLWLLRVSPDGRWIVVSSARDNDGWRETPANGDLVWDATTGKSQPFPGGKIHGHWAVATRTTGSRVHDLLTGEMVFDRPDRRGPASACGVLVDERAVVVGDDDGKLEAWDLTGGSNIHRLAERTAKISAIAVGPTGQIAAAYSDGVILAGTIAGGVAVVRQGQAAVRDCAFRSDTSLVAFEQSGTVRRIRYDRLDD